MRVFRSHAKRIFAPARLLVLLSTTALCGCSTVGVTSIDHGRTPYNEVIQDTSRQQALLNIVRVSKGESPLFVDVTEVDQATTAQTSIMGGATGIGAGANPRTTAGTFGGVLGALTGSASYTEAPTVRYIPLAGQALIAQVSTPLTPESIANLASSDWSFAALLTLSVDRLTPGYADYDAAMNALIDLEHYGAIIVAATQSLENAKTTHFSGLTISSTPPSAKDSLTLYYHPEGEAISPAACDASHNFTSEVEQRRYARKVTDALWSRLLKFYHKTGNVISLVSKGSPALINGVDQPPLIVTRSALGILKAAAEQEDSPTIAIMSPESIRMLIDKHKVRQNDACDDRFYSLAPEQSETHFEGGVRPLIENDRRKLLVANRISDVHRSLNSLFPEASTITEDLIQSERILSNTRRFMLISESVEPIQGAFVSVKHRDQWYSIFSDDKVSISTLALISQFNTIQAIPSQSGALTPTISVGARQ